MLVASTFLHLFFCLQILGKQGSGYPASACEQAKNISAGIKLGTVGMVLADIKA